MKIISLQVHDGTRQRRVQAMRIALAVIIILSSLALLYGLFVSSKVALASGINEYNTQANPWGIALDGHGHIFVAEPGCGVPLCGTAFPTSISEYNTADGTLVKTFSEPTGYSSPAFVAVDASGNVWFTEPGSGAVGKLVPTGNGTWAQWSASTIIAAPFGLVFDSNGNLWFTEYGTSKIGFLDPNAATPAIVENAIPTAGSNPYGITRAPNGEVWFTENAPNSTSATGIIASFTPTSNGTLGTIVEHTVGVPHPHLITSDSTGNIWYSGGFAGAIGKYNGSSDQVYDVSLNACVGSVVPGCGIHISGIGVDSNGMVWFDDALSQRIGYLNPTSSVFTAVTLANTSAHPHDGLLVDGSNNVWFTEEYAYKLAEIPGGVLPVTPTPTPTQPITPTPTPPVTTSPVSQAWYFAEGRVGKGFKEFLSLLNPDPTIDCAVNVQYLYTLDNTTTLSNKIVSFTIAHMLRVTRSVNIDLNIAPTQVPGASVSSIVTVNTHATPSCRGIVAERPMYFNHFNINSGSDALGATTLSKNYTFADLQTQSGTSSSITSFITILNPPGQQPANVVATYYSGGHAVGTQHIQVAGGARGTISPNGIGLPKHVVAVVSSDQSVVVERPTYYYNIAYGNAGTFSSAATVMGAPAARNDWLFAEGYTGGKFQEYLVLANVNNAPVTATIKLEYQGGHSKTLTYPVQSLDQATIDINYLSSHAVGTCDTNPCHVTPEVSIEVTSPSGLVVERELFFQYTHTVNGVTLPAMGGSDVIGQGGPASYVAYSFAEGYTNKGYNEWLTLQNPTVSAENISLTVINGYGRSFTQIVTVGATSRSTIDITQLVTQHLIHAGDSSSGYEVSMSLHAASGAVFVAERPMYWSTNGSGFSTQGGSDIIGYVGN